MTETIIKNPPWWNQRSALEKSLLIIVGFVILTTLILAIGIFFLLLQFPDPECATPGCMEAATQILKRMNRSVDPCENFYEFACGNFANIVKIPKTESSVNSLSIIKNGIKDQLRKVLEEPILSTEPKSLVLGKKFYSACLNEANIENQGLEPIKKIFRELGGWPIVEGDRWKEENFEWKQFNYKLKNTGLPFGQLINLFVYNDAKNPKQRVLQLYQGKMDLPKEYLDLDIKTNSLLQAYYQYMIDVAIIFGVNKTTAEEELMDVFQFQRKMAEISLSQIELRNASTLYTPMTIDEIQKLHPSIPWLEYINNILPPAIQVNSKEIIINQMPSYITKLEELLQKTPNRTIANYIFWTIIRKEINALPKQVQDAELKFLISAAGVSETNPRWKKCVSITKEYFDLITGSLYVRKYFDRESKKKVVEIVNNIEEVFTEVLKNIEWMDEETKENAVKKLKAIDKHIAYPDELLDDEKLNNFYKDLKINENSYLESTLMMIRFWTDYSFKRLREPVNKTDWTEHGDAAEAGAFYVPSDNSILFPAGILQGSFFSSDRPNYMNYGAIGFTIGHEITHGFDNEGRQYDKDGSVFDWWDPSTEKAFLKKAQCIIDQYSNYHVSEINQTINGELTEGENIADNGGIKEAYLAYKKWAERNKNQKEKKLPGLPYTPHQMFWISMASTWCTNVRPHHLKLLIDQDVHAPYTYRIIGSVSNQPEFAQDFNCPVGSKMNPKTKCHVW